MAAPPGRDPAPPPRACRSSSPAARASATSTCGCSGASGWSPAPASSRCPRSGGARPRPAQRRDRRRPPFANACSASRCPSRSRLLDQTLLAGVGNIQASESLFRAGIDPRRPARSLLAPEVKRLAAGIRSVDRLHARDLRRGRRRRRQARHRLRRGGRAQPVPGLRAGRHPLPALQARRHRAHRSGAALDVLLPELSEMNGPRSGKVEAMKTARQAAWLLVLVVSCGGGGGGGGGKGPAGHVILIDIDDHGLAGSLDSQRPEPQGAHRARHAGVHARGRTRRTATRTTSRC